MPTIKQLEAVYWIHKTGSFIQAADRLHTTQAAISKRVKELEDILGLEVFFRGARRVATTDKGMTIVRAAEKMIDLRNKLVEELSEPSEVLQTLTIGVTEVVTLTWLTEFLVQATLQMPKVLIHPQVYSSKALLELQHTNELDIIVLPKTPPSPLHISIPLSQPRFEWMCGNAMMESVKQRGTHSGIPLLIQGLDSGLGILMAETLKQADLLGHKLLYSTNSLLPLVGMTIANQGISLLPVSVVSHSMKAGLLHVLDAGLPTPPIVQYEARFKAEHDDEVVRQVCALMVHCKDFEIYATSTL